MKKIILIFMCWYVFVFMFLVLVPQYAYGEKPWRDGLKAETLSKIDQETTWALKYVEPFMTMKEVLRIIESPRQVIHYRKAVKRTYSKETAVGWKHGLKKTIRIDNIVRWSYGKLWIFFRNGLVYGIRHANTWDWVKHQNWDRMTKLYSCYDLNGKNPVVHDDSIDE